MARGIQLLSRVLAAVVMLMVVAQCGGSGTPAAEPEKPESASVATTEATDPTTTSVASTTAVSTTTVEKTTTTIEATTTVPATTTTAAPAFVIDPNCPTTPHAAVIDRARQRGWLCFNGVALPEFVITTAIEQPDPGTYPVFAKSMRASSRFGGHYSTMTHFVAFTRGEETGARVAFHTVPVLTNGEFAQPLATVGSQMLRGGSSGCIRVLPEQGQVIWDWLQKGDEVRVIN
ncbi:MAG: L,D-transpeptidase [Ilumatobacteraceae bacterium]